MAIGDKARKVFDELGNSMSGAVKDFIISIDQFEQRLKKLESIVYENETTGVSGESGEEPVGVSGASGESGENQDVE